MKLVVALCVLAFVALSCAKPQQHGRGCIYVMGRCYRECEEGTHAYSTGCSEKMPEATCDNPNPEKEKGKICDYTACYCDPPTVRDRSSGKCVPLDQCPQR